MDSYFVRGITFLITVNNFNLGLFIELFLTWFFIALLYGFLLIWFFIALLLEEVKLT